MKKALFYTASNVASVVQFGGIGALEGSQDAVARVPRRAAGAARPVLRGHSRARRRTCSPGSRRRARSTRSSASTRRGLAASGQQGESLSWAMTEYLIAEGRIGCVPGVDFGANGEGYLRFCFARDRKELTAPSSRWAPSSVAAQASQSASSSSSSSGFVMWPRMNVEVQRSRSTSVAGTPRRSARMPAGRIPAGARTPSA